MNLKNLMNKRVSDSRKISDRQGLTYDDDAWAEAEKIINTYDNEVGWRMNYNDPNNFPKIVGLIMKIARGFNIQNPEAVYEYLEDANYHRLNTVLALMGKLGKKYENEEKRVIEQYRDGNAWYEYLYNTLGFDYFKRGSVSDSRRVKDERTDVYTIEIYDDTDTEDVTPMDLQHDYYDIDEAIADLEVAMESFKDNPNEICGWVLAGEYLTEKGEVYGEPEVVYELCNY